MGYKESIEKLRNRCVKGDVVEFCKMVPCSTMIFYSACKKEDWQALTPTELAVINSAFLFFKKRDEMAEATKVLAEEL
ncbi:hypothetical protein [Parabacteroides pacaensis]|uniref:hypothetical protein n=1 Tax=Parabacteroides pacaensis TaxID=2086575 RepID=UPI000D0EAA33|nr:hypothetical protein [Parabacteroides pacaensis]